MKHPISIKEENKLLYKLKQLLRNPSILEGLSSGSFVVITEEGIQIDGETYPIVDSVARQGLEGKQDSITSIVATVDNNTGIPSATVSLLDGVLSFVFSNLKGDTGAQGNQGPQGDSVLVGQGDLPLAHTLGQDNTKAMSQKGVSDAVDSILHDLIFAEPTDYASINFVISPSDGKWYNNNNAPTHYSKVIPIPDGIKYIELTPTTSIMMWSLMSEVQTPSHSASIKTIATGLDNRYSASDRTVITEFSNAKYIVVRADSDNGAGCPIIKFVFDNNFVKNIDEQFNSIKKEMESSIVIIPITLDDYAAENCYLYASNGVATWQNGTELNDGKFIPVEPGCEYFIVPNKVNPFSRIAFLTDNTHDTGPVSNFAEGWNNFITLSGSKTYKLAAPTNAKYLFFNTHSLSGSLQPYKVAKVVTTDYTSSIADIANILPAYIVKNPIPIDLDKLYVHECSLGGGSYWTHGTTRETVLYGRHKALPVSEGDIYIVKCSNTNNFYGFVDDTYNPEYQNHDTIPYVSGTDRVLADGLGHIVTVPEGAAYMILGVVNGGGGVSSWNVIKIDAYKSRLNSFTKIRFATWNIGCFKNYNFKTSHTTGDIPNNKADEYAANYRKLINSIGADILGICEYYPNYPLSNSSTVTKDFIFQCFKQNKIGTFYGNAACNAIFFNSPAFISTSEKIFERTTKKEINQNDAQRYYKEVVININGINVHVVETHLDHSDSEIRASQIQELADTFSVYEYVIIGGDFNTASPSTFDAEMAILTSAGFTIANGGYIGAFQTHENGHTIDNIVTKGFAMSNINVIENAGNYSDHWVVYCDLELLT